MQSVCRQTFLLRLGVLLLLLTTSLRSDFVQKWFIPDGKDAYGRVIVGDLDNDGLVDIVVRRNQPIKVMFYELGASSQWQLQDSIVDDGDHLLWAYGDFDLDGFSDIAFQKTFGIPNVGIAIYESSDSFSYPTQEVWRDTVGFAVVQPISAYDVDNDGFSELLDNNGNGQPSFFWIFESIADNLYDTVYTTNPDTTLLDGPVSTHAFGDFDGDGRIEFVMGGMSAGAYGATYWIYESPANNTYEQVIQGYVPTKNIKDCFSVHDADGDGKPEFVVKGFVIPTAQIDAFIFEATGDNTYEIIQTFNLYCYDYYGGYSAAGDVDGDGLPEIALEAHQRVYMIEADSNNSFHVYDTLPGNDHGNSIAIYDIDQNGFAEVIISGNDATRIYEYQPGGVDETKSNPIAYPHLSATIVSGPLKLPKGKKCKVYDIMGRIMEPDRIQPGIYFIEVDGVVTQKVVKVR